MATRIGFVGAGNRANIFFEVINALPERFELAGAVSRTEERRDAFTTSWGAPAFDSVERMLDEAQPDFIVSAVPYMSNQDVNLQLLDLDIPLLLETPPAHSLDGLKQIWEKSQTRKARVGVAEQYIFRPYHRLTLPLVQNGLIGDVHFAHTSIAHGYHGISVMRHYLGVGIEQPEAIVGILHKDTLGENTVDQQIALFRFAGGKTGLIDFVGLQYMSTLRPIDLKVRGTKGELSYYEVQFMNDAGKPVAQTVRRHEKGPDGNIFGFYCEGVSLGNIAYWENPFGEARLGDDELAMAYMLDGMTQPDGPAYSLRDGLHDHHLGLLWSQAAQNLGPIDIPDVPWL